MSMGGALEFIQSFNNPVIIDACHSHLKKGLLHCVWKLLTVITDLIQLPKLLIKVEHKLFSSSFKVIIQNRIGAILGEPSFL